LSNNSLLLYTHLFTFAIICQQHRRLLLCFRLETSPAINPSGTNFILVFHKVYTNINWQTVDIIVRAARTARSYCST